MTLAAHGLSIVAMGSISNAKAIYGVSASGSPTKTNVGGSATIGVGQTQSLFTTADAAYSFTVLSTGATDVATLVISSGVVSQTVATPTITDGGGEDFEGVAIPTLASVSAIMIEANEVGTSAIAITSSLSGATTVNLVGDGQVAEVIHPVPVTLSTETISMTFTEIGQQLTFTVIGSTT